MVTSKIRSRQESGMRSNVRVSTLIINLFSKSPSNEQKNIKTEGRFSIFDENYGRTPPICQKLPRMGQCQMQGMGDPLKTFPRESHMGL